MESTIVGVVLIVVGIAAIIFRKKFVRDSVRFQNKAFGFHFGDKEIDVGTWFVPLWGVLLVVLGLLSLLRVIEWGR